MEATVMKRFGVSRKLCVSSIENPRTRIMRKNFGLRSRLIICADPYCPAIVNEHDDAKRKIGANSIDIAAKFSSALLLAVSHRLPLVQCREIR
jgi:hypothetical protein